MSWSDEGGVGCTERMKMKVPPADRYVFSLRGERISVNLDCSDGAGGSKEGTVSEREARSHYSAGTVLSFPHCLVLWTRVCGFTSRLLLNAPPVLSPSRLSSELGSVFCIGGWKVFTCCRPRRWGPVGRPGTSPAGASSASLLWSWWGSRRGPRWPPPQQWGGAPPAPRWWRGAPGPRPPAPSRPAPPPQPASWSM